MVMIIGSKTRKLNVKYTPLDAICEIVPYGGVPDRQAYNSRDGAGALTIRQALTSVSFLIVMPSIRIRRR